MLQSQALVVGNDYTKYRLMSGLQGIAVSRRPVRNVVLCRVFVIRLRSTIRQPSRQVSALEQRTSFIQLLSDVDVLKWPTEFHVLYTVELDSL